MAALVTEACTLSFSEGAGGGGPEWGDPGPSLCIHCFMVPLMEPRGGALRRPKAGAWGRDRACWCALSPPTLPAAPPRSE